MTTPAFLACDWGTTNLRAWLSTADGAPLESRDFAGLGVSRLAPGEAAKRFVDEVRPAFKAENLPAVLCGMIGSDLGWRPAGYLACPANAQDLAAALITVESGPNPVWIAPGLKGDGVANAPDVMRGEETQVFGFLAADPARLKGRHLICHPGTHAKWIVVEDGRIVRFVTAMTGELFHVLRTHSVLKGDQPPTDEAAFDAGLTAAGDGGGLAVRLFSSRARVVAGGADPAGSGAYLSGVLIGSEVASVPSLLGWDSTAQITLLGDANLSRWYGRALDKAGFSYEWHDGEAAALSGLAALYRSGAKL
jgi:2-dehydro-3-deoxygalactonokinase